MAKRMLIDASHAEETRVVVADGTRLEEFDFESAARKQLKGNVYLAKVMRVEPSLQAAFVDYGGNRHGFLPFNEIHPDYYQIPVEDREALYAEHAEANDADEPDAAQTAAAAEHRAADEALDGGEAPPDSDAAPVEPRTLETAEAAAEGAGAPGDGAESDGSADDGATEGNGAANGDGGDVEVMGGDELDDLERRRLHASRSLLSRRYHIQEVIRKRQILLVQVVKEERGNKGAALTTYLSLAGRYIVLMPNAIRGGGISRKIVNADDRRRLKKIMNDLDIPARMAVIVRTAGLSRSKTEIKRDLEYLLRRWQNIRDLTMESTAPCVINEEANLIRRSIRDLYTRDIEQILIEGDEGYKTAKTFMKTMIPSHAARVKPYRDRIPLFVRYQIESQLDSMYGPELQLKSGGYLVLSPTEALVAIDVNSGRATKERTIEETALKTNLEAAEEIARQLRLRDLAGLIVIDFIDMDENRNQRAVERKLKEAMRVDRARIRMGRISPFGLMELSRQRLRPSLVEASMERCVSCGGTGVRRSVDSSAVHALRAIEEEGLQGRSAEILLRVPAAVGLYILNRKRRMLEEIEQRYDFAVSFEQDDSLVPPSYAIERLAARAAPVEEPAEEEASEAPQADTEAKAETAEPAKRRRRRRRKPRGEAAEGTAAEPATSAEPAEPAQAESEADDKTEDAAAAADGKAEDAPRAKRRRRGRRGGRGRTAKEQEQQDTPREAPGEAEAEETSTPPLAAEGEAPHAPAPDSEQASPPVDPATEGSTGPADGAIAPAAAETEALPAAAPAAEPVAAEPVAPEPVAPEPVALEPVAPELPAADTAQASEDAAEAPGPAAPAIADHADAVPVDDGEDRADDGEDRADDAPAKEDDHAHAEEAAPAPLPDDRPRRRGWWQRIASSSR